MRRTASGIAAILILTVPLWAAPEDGVDLTLPRSTDRYIPGLISGEEAQVDRRMEVTEQDPGLEMPEEGPAASEADSEEGLLSRLLQDQTFINLILLVLLLGVFVLYKLRSGGSRR